MSATTTNLKHPGDTDDVLGRSRAHAVDPGDSTFHRLISTSDRFAPAAARLTLGLVMLPHALQKTLGWFGGYGFSGTYGAFTMKMGLPAPVAALVIFGETLGAVALVLGVLTRIGAAVIIAIMLGAIAVVHVPNGFFMNWNSTQIGEGFEYHLLAVGLGIVCLLQGGGRASIDHALTRWRPAAGGSVSPVMTRD